MSYYLLAVVILTVLVPALVKARGRRAGRTMERYSRKWGGHGR